MRQLVAFMKKEWTEQLRSGRLMILGILFVLFGIMNPAIAKLTPWMYEILADTVAESGMTLTPVEVDAMTSWTQFFKNIPIGLIVFILLQSGIFAKEYQSGTLILALTKGLDRYKVVISKAVVLTVTWSASYWLCFAITYGYNAFFWDNGTAHNLVFTAGCWWLLGTWTVLLMVFFSSVAKTNTGVLLGTGGAFLASYLIGMLPKMKKYTPTSLMNTSSLLHGIEDAQTNLAAITVTAALSVVCIIACIPILNKKQL